MLNSKMVEKIFHLETWNLFGERYFCKEKAENGRRKPIIHKRFRESILSGLIVDSIVLNMKLRKFDNENDRLDGKPHFSFLCPERKR